MGSKLFCIGQKMTNIKTLGNVKFIFSKNGQKHIETRKNSVKTPYLSEFAKLVAGETQEENLEIQYIELFDSSGSSMIRKGFVETGRQYSQTVFFSTFDTTEANGTIDKVRFYYGTDATAAAGSGLVAAEADCGREKDSTYTLTIEYSYEFKNAEE